MDWMPDWLKKALSPVEPKGKGSINVYAGKRLDELDEDPNARMEMLSELERSFDPNRPDETDPDGRERWRRKQAGK